MFGILVCRTVEDRGLLLKRYRDVVHDDHCYIMALDDADIEELLALKEAGDEQGIDNFLKAKFDKLISRSESKSTNPGKN